MVRSYPFHPLVDFIWEIPFPQYIPRSEAHVAQAPQSRKRRMPTTMGDAIRVPPPFSQLGELKEHFQVLETI